VVDLNGQWIANSEFAVLEESDTVTTKRIRYRTVGDMTCTAAVESEAATVDRVIEEIVATRISERGETRIDDRVTEAAMEDRKKGGYF
jgi:sulfate adenylyltransferase subunit 2